MSAAAWLALRHFVSNLLGCCCVVGVAEVVLVLVVVLELVATACWRIAFWARNSRIRDSR